MNIGNEMIRAMQDCDTTKALRRPAGSQRKNFRITTAMYTSFVTTIRTSYCCSEGFFYRIKEPHVYGSGEAQPSEWDWGDYRSQETR